jgi:DNA polymerase III subunit alpha
VAAWYAEVFKDRYYLEVQAHEAGEQRSSTSKIFALAGEMNLPVVATNDAHFLKADDHDAHDVLLCIGLKKDRLDADRMRYDAGCTSRARRRSPRTSRGRARRPREHARIADAVDVSSTRSTTSRRSRCRPWSRRTTSW